MDKIIKKFDSKKNKVLLIENNNQFFVRKIFQNIKSYENELYEFNQLKGKYTPKILAYQNYFIDMEYIDGNLFLDEFLQSNNNKIKKIANLMADFIKYYRSIHSNKILNDENFRNYIIYNEKCYRIDFEETKIGTIYEWLAKIICFAILYNINYDNLDIFIITLLNQFDLKLNDIKTHLNYELNFVCSRRKIKIPIDTLNKLNKNNPE